MTSCREYEAIQGKENRPVRSSSCTSLVDILSFLGINVCIIIVCIAIMSTLEVFCSLNIGDGHTLYVIRSIALFPLFQQLSVNRIFKCSGFLIFSFLFFSIKLYLHVKGTLDENEGLVSGTNILIGSNTPASGTPIFSSNKSLFSIFFLFCCVNLWYYLMVFVTIPSLRTFSGSFDASGHVFLILWSIFGLVAVLVESFYLYRNSKSPRADFIFFMLIGCTLLYLLVLLFLFIQTVLFFHSTAEKLVAACLSIFGSCVLHLKYPSRWNWL